MKIGILTVAYREERFIKDCIRQFRGVGKHLCLISDTPWHGEKEPMDKTPEIAENEGAEVIISDWVSEAKQRNWGVERLKDYDWILIVDADERYDKTSIDNLLKFLEEAELPAYGIGRLKTYWKTTDYVIDPEESGGLIVAIRPTVRFTDKRCIDSQWDFLPKNIIMHHYSYVRTDNEIKRKLSTFEHACEIIPNWYNNIWLKWTPEMENLHPVNPSSFRKAVKKI